MRHSYLGLVVFPGAQSLQMTSSTMFWIFAVHFATDATEWTLWAPRLSVWANQPSFMNCSLFIATSMFAALSTVTATILSIMPDTCKTSLISSAKTGPVCTSYTAFVVRTLSRFPLQECSVPSLWDNDLGRGLSSYRWSEQLFRQ